MGSMGRAPAAATVEALKKCRAHRMNPADKPAFGSRFQVPFRGWALLHKDHGSLHLEQLFARRIDTPKAGYPVTPARCDGLGRKCGYCCKAMNICSKAVRPTGKRRKRATWHAQPLFWPKRLRASQKKRFCCRFLRRLDVAAKNAAICNSLGGLHRSGFFTKGSGFQAQLG